MRGFILFLLFFIILIGGTVYIFSGSSDNDIKDDSPSPEILQIPERQSSQEEKFTYTIKIAPSIEEHKIYFQGKASHNFMKVTSISVYKNDDMIPFQYIKGFETITPVLNDKLMFVVEDVNFDNYNDIRLVKRGTFSSIPFIYFIYDPSTGKFKRIIEYEKITSPQVDYANKEIISFNKKDVNQYITDYYKIKDNKPFLYKQEIRTFLHPDTLEIIVKELKDGVMEVVEREIID